MRSRYSAYALGCVEYIMGTTHPDGPHYEADRAGWRLDLLSYCRETIFTGLEVVAGTQEDGRGTVDFRASMSQVGENMRLVENSLFLQVDGRWLYHSAIDGDD